MSTKNIERRSFGQIGVQKRADGQGDEMALVGFAASYNVLSRDLGGFRETIAPGAFTRSLNAGDDVVCLQQHDPSKVLGRRSVGTLTLTDTPKGLGFRCQLDPNNQAHRDLHASVKRGDISECSFAMIVPDGGDEFSEDTDERGQKFVKRTLRDVNLLDVSCVLFPAYSAPGATAVGARSADADNSVEGKKRWLEIQQADWARRDRAHEIGLAVLRDVNLVSEKRDNQDFLSMREKLQAAMAGCAYVGHDDDYAYGVSETDEEDNSIYRWSYELDAEGHVKLDNRVALKPEEVSSVRSAVESVFADRELRARMRAASGISVR